MNAAELHTYRIEQASSVKLPYVLIAVALVVLAVVIGRFQLPHIPEAEGGHAAETGTHESILRRRNLVMGALAIFCYVGAEVSIGSFLVNYMHEPNIGNLNLETAAKFLTVYWGGTRLSTAEPMKRPTMAPPQYTVRNFAAVSRFRLPMLGSCM